MNHQSVLLILALTLSSALSAQDKEGPVPPDSLVRSSDSIFMKMAEENQFITDTVAIAYVREVMDDILHANGYNRAPFKVYIRNSLTINAAMYANGNMLLTSGLLLRLNSREELSMVVSHELSHYLLGHFSDPPPEDEYEIALQSLIREYDSDSLGFILLQGAGFPAAAAVSALEKLPPAHGAIWILPFISARKAPLPSHPPTPRRIERLRKYSGYADTSVFVGNGDYGTRLKSLRNETRWDMLLSAKKKKVYTTQIIMIDSLLHNLPQADKSDYYGYLVFQQSEAIINLMRLENSLAERDIRLGQAQTVFRNNDLEAERKYYAVNLSTHFGKGAMREVHRLFTPRLLANLQELATMEAYRLESKRLNALYLERLGLYADARVVIIEYLVGEPTHPGRRFVRSLLKRIPEKNKKKPNY